LRPPPTSDDARRLSSEVRRSRGRIAREQAAELCERARTSMWVAQRQLSYGRTLLDEVRGHLGMVPRRPS